MAYQQFVVPDWSKLSAGTGQYDLSQMGAPFYNAFGGQIAESWKVPEFGTFVLQIRRGVHYALDPTNEASRLMNGRELTADDAVYNVWRLHTDPRFPNSGPRFSQRAMSAAVKAEKTGPWEVTLRMPVDPWAGFWWVAFGGCSQYLYAKEVIEKYGDANDFRRVIGTGPFIFSDYVPGSVATFTRNPTYWEKNPVGPGKGDQLPYADKVNMFIVPDLSTRLAIMRTGRGDWVSDIQREDGRALLSTTPHIKYATYVGASYTVEMRTELNELPFKDKRVRHALMMAIDRETIKRDLYRGDAATRDWPVSEGLKELYVPDSELPESTLALYKYNTEKAKQLLTEAGYPNGFKTQLMVLNTAVHVDLASVVKEMWSKVGVEAVLQPRDNAVYTAAGTARSYEGMRMVGGTGTLGLTSIFEMNPERVDTNKIMDPFIRKTYDEMQNYHFINQPKVNEIYRKQVIPYRLDASYVLPVTAPYAFTFWQPWLKNHYGEQDYHIRLWTRYAWVDQDLKEKMTGRR